MKSDKEFLATMWQTVSEIEYEEMQKQLAKKRNAKIIKRNILLYVSLFVLFTTITIMILFDKSNVIKDTVYFIAIILLPLAYYSENFSLKNPERIGGLN